MKLPHLFRQIHGNHIFNMWMELDQAPYVRIVPQEPLGRVTTGAPGDAIPTNDVTIVTVHCWNDHGTMQLEAASLADLKVAKEWAQKHKDTPPEDFKWYPQMTVTKG